MSIIASIINKKEVTDISSELLMDNGKMKLLPAEAYKKLKWEDFRTFCHFNGRYGIPTVELVEFIKKVIDGRDAIEIGSGAGDLGYHLGIRMTDSKIQQDPCVALQYQAMGQPVIKYPDDVEKIDALYAVKKYRPKVVVSSWITPYSPKQRKYNTSPHGVREPEILARVSTLIIVGNLDIHGDKPILKSPHRKLSYPWIVSRAKNPENNRIFIWTRS